MTIVTEVDQYILDTCPAVPLPRYAQIIGLDECDFWSVVNRNVYRQSSGCNWTQENRRLVLHHLIEAQSEIENILHYPVTPRWVEDRLMYGRSLNVLNGKIIAAGKQATSVVELAASVTTTTDPSVITVATTLTDASEIVIYHAGTTAQIYPSEITFLSGTMTIKVPRCRTVKPQYIDLPTIDYNDLSMFADEVDVMRIYNDPTDHGYAYWLRSENGYHTEDQSLFLEIQSHDLGLVKPHYSIYSGGMFKMAAPKYHCTPTGILLRYYAGLTSVPNVIEDAIVRLAHSRMPDEPCGCDLSKRMWARDRAIPEMLSRERLNCPFGLADGAWVAWQISYKERMVRIGVM